MITRTDEKEPAERTGEKKPEGRDVKEIFLFLSLQAASPPSTTALLKSHLYSSVGVWLDVGAERFSPQPPQERKELEGAFVVYTSYTSYIF